MIGAAAVGLVAVVLAVVLLTRGHKPQGPISVEVKRPTPDKIKVAPPEPTPEPEAAPVRPAPPAAARAVPAAKPAPREIARRVPEPRPRPEPVAPAVEKPAPERKPVVASAQHVAAATTPARRSGLPSEEDQRLAKEAYARGNAQLFQGKVDEAIASFKESQRLDPRNPAVSRGLGLAYMQSGNAGQAVVNLKKYLKASPTASDRALIEKRIEQLSAR
jgi:tetratricopeptide (TPR) repeat protein